MAEHRPTDLSKEDSDSIASLGIPSNARVVILTGAGISAESGISTFRDAGGLWEQHRIEDVATPQAFRSDPEFVWAFYRARRKQALSCSPNDGHRSIAQLEQRLCGSGGHLTLITQNVDILHQDAGSEHVIPIHGGLFDTICSNRKCPEKRNRRLDRTTEATEIPRCERCNSLLRPGVVWFGENLDVDNMREASSAIRSCQWFLAIGTSGAVYPVAGYVWDARNAGARTVLVNLERAENTQAFDVFVQGKAAQILPRLLAIAPTLSPASD